MRKIYPLLFLVLIRSNIAVGQQMCGDYPNPLQTPVTTELEHILCTDLFFCTDLTYVMNDQITRGLIREQILRGRIARLKRKLRK